MSRAARLLRLMQELRRHRGPVSATTLSEALEVSIRSVYRDVQTLREQGADIAGEAGVGYVLKPGFLLPPLMFSDEEIEAIVLGLRLTSEHADAALTRAADNALAKLRAVLPKELRDYTNEIGLLVGPSRRRAPDALDLASVRDCLRRQCKASILYRTEKGELSQRTIWPLAVGYFEHARLVVAWCETRNDFRSFRTDRIQSWQPLDEKLPKPRRALLTAWRAREAIPDRLAL